MLGFRKNVCFSAFPLIVGDACYYALFAEFVLSCNACVMASVVFACSFVGWLFVSATVISVFSCCVIISYCVDFFESLLS